jgi:phosphopantothenoylcysteine decarboxylase/phosphopantothenate--cysteine ligase
MEQRRVLLAVSGGIAAYKIPELVRQLRGAGHEVRCVLTRAALEFVSPLTLQTLSQQAVRTELFDPSEEGQIDHIALADWAEAAVVAPATANLCHEREHVETRGDAGQRRRSPGSGRSLRRAGERPPGMRP